MESDLHPKYINNKLMKYADDTNLLVISTWEQKLYFSWRIWTY